MEDVVEAEVVEEAQPSTAVTIATVQVTPEEAREQNERINSVITEVLKEGQNGDYWKIPGTPGPPVLLQPGAETLQRFFGLGRLVDDPKLGEIEVDGKPFFSAQIKVSITNNTGRVIAESIGWCDDTETKRNGGPGSKWKGNRHTIIQMATKRAYVSAIKAATGTSMHFTADLEDQQAAPARAPIEDSLPSVHDILILTELFARKGGKTIPDAQAWLGGQPAAKRDSRAWVALQVLNLVLRPDPLPKPESEKTPESETVATPPPELPADPTPLEAPHPDEEDLDPDASIPF